jgi:ribosomal-protein-alanine N-acetyltransferase
MKRGGQFTHFPYKELLIKPDAGKRCEAIDKAFEPDKDTFKNPAMRDSVVLIDAEIPLLRDIKESSVPTLTTAKLMLRQLELSDAPQVLRLHSEIAVNEFLERPRLTSIAQAESYICEMQSAIRQGEALAWSINFIDNPKMIGAIYFWNIYPTDRRAEIGLEFLTEHQEKGLAFEVLTRITEYAFRQLCLHSIEADVDPANFKAIKTLEKCGFRMEGYFHDITFHQGRFRDRAIYTLLDPYPTAHGGSHNGQIRKSCE